MPAAESGQPQRRNTVLITGGSGGIGRALSLAFARAGWTVGIHYLTRPDAAAHTFALVEPTSPKSQLYKADIRLSHEVQAMIDAFSKDHGQLDAMVCNAAAATGHLVIRHRIDEWQRVIETTLTGTFHCVQAAGRHMVAAGGGTIIVVGSHAGAQGGIGQAAYASAKAGLLGLVRTAGREWGAHNVRINLVYPGRQPTSLASSAHLSEETHTHHLLSRSPNLDEVARTIVHLAQLQDVSGQAWNLDSRLV